ncbi:MAG: alpha-L-fucosidase [Victivallales bacterium]|nr:alpha-L-fucosidase [Victivallales bacterium]
MVREAKTVNYNEEGLPDGVPTYLVDQAETYRTSPRDAGLEWFSGAYIGLSVTYGLHSLVGRGEHILRDKGISGDGYRKLADNLTGVHFDAIDIVELAIASGARYIHFPVIGEDGFTMSGTEHNEYNSVSSAARRDFAAELGSTCEYNGLGLILECHLGCDLLRHPDGMSAAEVHDHVERMREQIHTLLLSCGPVAAIAFSGIDAVRGREAEFELESLYKMVGIIQPQCLVSFQQGLRGEEDYLTAETLLPESSAAPEVRGLISGNSSKPLEIAVNMTPDERSYNADAAGRHLNLDALWEKLRYAHINQANLRINIALMPDGSLDLEDINTLLEFGKRLEKEGLPG